ncbi:hypothetical protein [Candidatus Proelusimicrobium volucris]|uniref:hypothetical protein n=1 Tax=Candidatus Proelusimicrobium volucris TaxID=3416225 RepID=UPI003D0EF877
MAAAEPKRELVALTGFGRNGEKIALVLIAELNVMLCKFMLILMPKIVDVYVLKVP